MPLLQRVDFALDHTQEEPYVLLGAAPLPAHGHPRLLRHHERHVNLTLSAIDIPDFDQDVYANASLS
jgi:hypothetical protein